VNAKSERINGKSERVDGFPDRVWPVMHSEEGSNGRQRRDFLLVFDIEGRVTPFLTLSPQPCQSSAFSPTLFVGEKVAKPDEGGNRSSTTSAHVPRFQVVRTRAWLDRLSISPLIRLRHLLPPQKARGEKALDGESTPKKKKG